jgi:type I restriction enzyme S subunit
MTVIQSTSPSCVWVSPDDIGARLDASYFHHGYLSLDSALAHFPKRDVVPLDRCLVNPRRVLYQKTTSFARDEAPEGAVPFISGVDLDGSTMTVNWSSARYVERWMLDRYPKGRLTDGSLLIKVKGPNQHTAFVSKADRTALVSGTVFFSEVRGCNPFYLAGYLSSRHGTAWRSRLRTNTTVEFIGNDELRAVPVPLPDRRIQDFIGAKVELAERCRALASREHEKLAADIATLYQGCPHDAEPSLSTVVGPAEVDGSRLDAWYHQRHFITLTDWLRRNPAFVELGKVAKLSADRWSPRGHGQSSFRYIEISNVDPSTGHVSHSEVPVESAPSRARKLVRRFDVLASTVRPNRGAVGLVPESLDGAVATTGFAVVRPASKTDAFFLLAVLRHPASTAQLMRCNTGSAYPAIEESVLPQIWIPGAKPETRKSLGGRELKRTTLQQTAVDLVNQAKADVEALIEGTLDVQAILAGTLKAPTTDDIPELAEVAA